MKPTEEEIQDASHKYALNVQNTDLPTAIRFSFNEGARWARDQKPKFPPFNEIQQESINELKAEKERLLALIASDSVYTLLRFGVKSPSTSGVDDLDDNYTDLYEISVEQRNSPKPTTNEG